MKQEDKSNKQTDGVNAGSGASPNAERTGNKPQFTKVENAHASGLGAMGRNDEKLPTGAEEEPAPNDPVY